MSHPSSPAGPHFAFELTWWLVTLSDGSTIRLRADAGDETDDDLVFSAFIQGKPMTILELCRIPMSAVASWEGGRASL